MYKKWNFCVPGTSKKRMHPKKLVHRFCLTATAYPSAHRLRRNQNREQFQTRMTSSKGAILRRRCIGPTGGTKQGTVRYAEGRSKRTQIRLPARRYKYITHGSREPPKRKEAVIIPCHGARLCLVRPPRKCVPLSTTHTRVATVTRRQALEPLAIPSAIRRSYVLAEPIEATQDTYLRRQWLLRSPVVPDSLWVVLHVVQHVSPIEEQVGIFASPVGFLVKKADRTREEGGRSHDNQLNRPRSTV